MSNTRSNSRQKITSFIISGLILVTALLVFFNRQAIQDQITVWSYTPSTETQQLAARTGLTGRGEHLFYASKASVADQAAFNEHCPRKESKSPIVGCFTANHVIYVYNITDERLNGIQEVTAAHELLHAVWVRMSEPQQQELKKDLEAAVSTVQSESLKERLAYYQRTEPDLYLSELHSIVGTEITQVSESLEQYYRQYFDRNKVLAFYAQYSSAFDTAVQQSKNLSMELEALSESISERQAVYEKTVAQLSSDITTFNEKAAREGGFTSMQEFNTERNALDVRVRSVRSEADSINAQVTTYNEKYELYRQVAEQIQQLNTSLDSMKDVGGAPSI